jgi:uncharacterized membrane protein YjfL (UPF0719 family)
MSSEVFLKPLVMSVTFGVVGLMLIIFGFKLLDWVTPRIDVQKELAERHNMAVGVVVGAMILGVSYVVAHAIS